MDLFSISSVKKNIVVLKNEIDSYLTKKKLIYDDYKLFYPSVSNNKDIIFIVHCCDYYFNSQECKLIISLCKFYNIDSYCIMQDFPIFKKPLSRLDIREYSPFIKRLIDVIDPKLIVFGDEDSQYSLLARKELHQENNQIRVLDDGRKSLLIHTLFDAQTRSVEFNETIQKKEWGIITNFISKGDSE